MCIGFFQIAQNQSLLVMLSDTSVQGESLPGMTRLTSSLRWTAFTNSTVLTCVPVFRSSSLHVHPVPLIRPWSTNSAPPLFHLWRPCVLVCHSPVSSLSQNAQSAYTYDIATYSVPQSCPLEQPAWSASSACEPSESRLPALLPQKSSTQIFTFTGSVFSRCSITIRSASCSTFPKDIIKPNPSSLTDSSSFSVRGNLCLYCKCLRRYHNASG